MIAIQTARAQGVQAPPPAAEPPPHPGAAAPAPAAQEHMRSKEATSVLGKKVRSQSGEDIGRIVNVLVDEAGQPRAAIIDFGGFMGVGNRKIAVAWNALHFAPGAVGEGQITLDMTPDQIKATPEYKDERPVTVAAPPKPSEGKPAAAEPR